MSIDPRIIYTPDYDIHFHGLEKLHPFDSRKYSRAWNSLQERFGSGLEERTLAPSGEVSSDDLHLIHHESYLEKLNFNYYVATALEFPFISVFPMKMVEQHILIPMRLGTAGTIQAGELALKHGLVVNFSGGYHHASREKGEGFCLYADVPIAIEKLRATGAIAPDAPALIIDLDIHQGNGHERVYRGDNRVHIFDMYNRAIYPNDYYARERINCEVRVESGCGDTQYLQLLSDNLPMMLDAQPAPAIAFYIAGTDPYKDDLLGRCLMTMEGVLARDIFVLRALIERGIPTAMVLGGGYSKASYQMVANTVAFILETWGE